MQNRLSFVSTVARGLWLAGLVFGLVQGGVAQGEKSAEELAKESEAACIASASTKVTQALIVEKVTKACALLEKEGKAAFGKFKGKDSEFIFAGTYIWINDLDGTMLMHPIKYKMDGQPLLGMQDTKGKKFFVEMIDLCKSKGSGWSDYLWPKPGSKESSVKVSFVKKAVCDGTDVLVGCGVYDMVPEDIKKLVGP